MRIQKPKSQNVKCIERKRCETSEYVVKRQQSSTKCNECLKIPEMPRSVTAWSGTTPAVPQL